MTTIRTPVWPQAAAQPQGASVRPAESAKLAAQRAFFAAAMGQPGAAAALASAQAPARAAPAAFQAEPVRAPAAAPVQTAVADEPPTRIPRPGSLVNILV